MQQRAAQRSPELQAAWTRKLASYKPEQLIFVDESVANGRTSHQKYGWSPSGVRPHEYIPFECSKRWSILPVYTVDGYLTWDIQHGSFSQILFEDFIDNQLLPFCSPFPGPRSVIVMDNAPIHQSEVCRYPCMDLMSRGCRICVAMPKFSSNSSLHIRRI